MTTHDFITELFCRIAEQLAQVDRKHSQGKLYASEIVTLAMLYALKGVGQRAFWRWLVRDYRSLFPHLPHRTRLFRLFNSHQSLIDAFLAEPSMLGVIDSYGMSCYTQDEKGAANNRSARKASLTGAGLLAANSVMYLTISA